jgi:hypothetical protein
MPAAVVCQGDSAISRLRRLEARRSTVWGAQTVCTQGYRDSDTRRHLWPELWPELLPAVSIQRERERGRPDSLHARVSGLGYTETPQAGLTRSYGGPIRLPSGVAPVSVSATALTASLHASSTAACVSQRLGSSPESETICPRKTLRPARRGASLLGYQQRERERE